MLAAGIVTTLSFVGRELAVVSPTDFDAWWTTEVEQVSTSILSGVFFASSLLVKIRLLCSRLAVWSPGVFSRAVLGLSDADLLLIATGTGACEAAVQACCAALRVHCGKSVSAVETHACAALRGYLEAHKDKVAPSYCKRPRSPAPPQPLAARELCAAAPVRPAERSAACSRASARSSSWLGAAAAAGGSGTAACAGGRGERV